MEFLTAFFAAVALLAFIAYAVVKRDLPSGVRYYVRGAILLLGWTLTVALLRAGQVVSANALLDAGLLAFLVVVCLGFVLTFTIERREQRQLRLLRSAANLLMPSSELYPLLNHVLDIVHAAVRVDGSSIMLLEGTSRDLKFAAARGIDPARAQGYKVSLDHPAIATLWTGQGPLVIPDVNREPAFRQLLVRTNIRSFYAIPMVTNDILVGFLNVHRTRVSMLEPEEVDLLTALACQAAVAIHQSRLYGDLRQRYVDTISVLSSAMEVNDPHTLGHSRRVAAICELIAEELNVPAETQETIEVAALLHDVGKLGVNSGVLRKLGQLSPEERTEVRSHAILGSQVLREAEALRDILPAVLHHHERWDGRGYPDGLSGENIPLMARIVAAADAFEVMTAGRAYREARQPDSAIAEMKREAGRQFDPSVVNAMVRLYERGALSRVALEARGRDSDDRESAAAS